MTGASGKAQEKKSDGKGILYLGEDEGFWKDLQDGLRRFKQIQFDFNLVYEKEPKKIQNLLKRIYDERPRVVFVDLAKNTEEMLHLLRAQNRMNAPIKPFIIALTAYKQGDSVKRHAIMAGAQCAHIKSAEIDAVVYDAICFAFHNALEDHGFAMAKMSDEVQAFFPAKASVISPKGLRVESNYKAKVGELSLLNTHWSESGILKSRLARLGSQDQKDLFYNFTYAQELGFEFAPFDPPEDASAEDLEKLKAKHEQEIKESKDSMLEWIQNAKPRSCPKTLKTLVIDKELTLYTDQPLSDSYPFVIRVQPYLLKVKQELMQYMPQMIAYNTEDVSEEEVEANQDLAHMFNEAKNLQYLIKVIKSINDYNPFIVVFNTEHDTAKLQKVLGYTQIIGYQEALNSELIIKMGQILQKKLFGDEDPFGENVVVLDKKSPNTYAEFETSISLVGCSENDLYFDSDEEFEVGTVIRLNVPADMYITIAEPPKTPKASGRYYAVIHGIGEEEKKELRRYINSVFFRTKEAAKLKDKEEVEKTKEKYIEQKKAKEEKPKQEDGTEHAKEERKEKDKEKEESA